jgi:MFS family permease
VELAPLVVFGLYGGVLADRFDRRRLIVVCEAGLAWVASVTSARFSAAIGGVCCTGAVGLVCLLLPGFTRYRAQASGPAERDGQ